MESVGLKIVRTLFFMSIAATCVGLVLLLIDLRNPTPSTPDEMRAHTAKLLMAALEKYRSAKGAYPQLDDNRLADLKAPLVDGGFLKEIPPDDFPGRSTNAVSLQDRNFLWDIVRQERQAVSGRGRREQYRMVGCEKSVRL